MQQNKNKSQDCLAEKKPITPAGESIRCCVDCATGIPPDRISAVPETTRCVECQRDIERSGRWDWGMAE